MEPSADADARATEAPPQRHEPASGELVFEAHDLGRDRVPQPDDAGELGFAPARRVQDSPVDRADSAHAIDPAGDGFVIREAEGVVPAVPLDALVIGAPLPVAPPEDESPPPGAESFRIGSLSGGRAAPPQAAQLWMTRDPAPLGSPAAVSRRGWAPRNHQQVDRSAHATMLRLREEAVNVSWNAAWTAVSHADRHTGRRRRRLTDPG